MRRSSPRPADPPIFAEYELWAIGDQRLGRNSVNAYLASLRALARFVEQHSLEIHNLTPDDIQLFLASRRHLSHGTQNNTVHALRSFHRFLSERKKRPNNPMDEVPFKSLKLPFVRPRQVGQVSQKIARLQDHHQEVARFCMELLREGVTLLEIFGIDEDPPVGTRVTVENGRGERRSLPLSLESRKILNKWGGRLPIGVRAFQRALEKVDLSPKLLGEPSRSSVNLELHPVLEGSLNSTSRDEAHESIAKTFFQVREALRQVKGDPDDNSSIDRVFLEELNLQDLVSEGDGLRSFISGALATFGSRTSREELIDLDPEIAKEAIVVGDLLVRILEKWKDKRRMELVRADYNRPVSGLSEAELREMPPLEFQNWVIQRFHGTLNPRLSGDMGIDGYDRFGYPIQVKRSDVGRPVVDSFFAAVERSGLPKGYLVAFGFSKQAEIEARRLAVGGKVDLRLVTIRDLLVKVPE